MPFIYGLSPFEMAAAHVPCLLYRDALQSKEAVEKASGNFAPFLLLSPKSSPSKISHRHDAQGDRVS